MAELKKARSLDDVIERGNVWIIFFPFTTAWSSESLIHLPSCFGSGEGSKHPRNGHVRARTGIEVNHPTVPFCLIISPKSTKSQRIISQTSQPPPRGSSLLYMSFVCFRACVLHRIHRSISFRARFFPRPTGWGRINRGGMRNVRASGAGHIHTELTEWQKQTTCIVTKHTTISPLA